MKTHKLTLLLTLLPALTLTVFADNKVVTSGTVVESGSTYASVSNQAALQVSGSETLYEGANLTLSATFNTGNGKYGAFADNQARLVLSGGTITTSGSSGAVGNGGHALYVTGSATARAEQIDIRTAGDEAFGIWAINTATLSLRDAVIETTGNGGRGVYLSLLATGTLTNIDIRTTGSNGVGVYTTNAQATLLDVTIDTTGDHGVGIDSWGSDSTISGTRVTVNTAGVDAHGILVVNGGTVMLRDSAVTTRQAAVINIYDSTYRPGSGAPSRVILSGGTYDANGNALVGARIANDSSTALDTANAIVEIEHATVSGAQLLNNQLATGTIALTLTDVDATNAGGITVSGSNAGVTTVTVNAGSGVNGAVINSGSGALTVNLNNSALTGDVTNTGAGTLTIILDNDSVGTGGFAGGNLITGSDSAWTFDKDSHGNYGENHGVWNIGDYAVTFDNLTHSGTVTISVNSDTGDGGSITITDTADGEGTVHINTTGNGQLNPNDVLPGIVSGDGTEHWQWDPIDWGIDTIIKDGDHFIKSGVSPAGAVLNSSVAIQQAMWFAQQNSLLKRMGELRYGARASRPLAGETPAFHIIENLWLRSYGQQLNVGSQVSGKAYEQLIYGVDLGTDHKFTLSADSDLYLGVYAGYGRSDLDYRTPGTDGEINSYYGGLYATWLHASGFYIDATFKAASVNNDLKAPYSGSQITANYSDVNLGGSLEIGHKFTFADDWFIEPQFQVNYLHILAENYQAGPMTISAQDLDALQLRLGSLFGRSIKLANSGALQPYIKISGVETISSGGTIKNGYQHTRANTDGARAEVGGGIIWQLDADNQLHLDYEASFGDKYDKPWGLTAGYRHQF